MKQIQSRVKMSIWQNQQTSYNPQDKVDTLVTAWLRGIKTVSGYPKSGMLNLILHIENPNTKNLSNDEIEIINQVDEFIGEKGQSVESVADTIFPESHFGEKIYDKDIETLSIEYEENEIRIKIGCGWGSYFQRMIRWQINEDENINQIADNIDMLKDMNSGKSNYHICELLINDPKFDIKRERKRQCLSLIELNPIGNKLDMTAIYRNHDYVFKALGNFFGLSNLQKYISKHSGFEQGSLTIVSTHAYLESAKRDAIKLERNCRKIVN